MDSFNLTKLHVYPFGEVEFLCLDRNLKSIENFFIQLTRDLNITGITTEIIKNRNSKGKTNGYKLVIINPDKNKNISFKKEIITVFDKYSIDYENTPLERFKTLVNSYN
jgi:nucleoside-triphosphatase THEP1